MRFDVVQLGRLPSLRVCFVQLQHWAVVYANASEGIEVHPVSIAGSALDKHEPSAVGEAAVDVYFVGSAYVSADVTDAGN